MTEPMHVKLRSFQISDLQDFLSYQQHPAVLRLMPVEALSVERALQFITSQAKLTERTGSGYRVFAVELNDQSRIIGEVGIDIDEKASIGKLGWAIHPEFQRQGHAFSAVSQLLEIAFSKLCLHRVTAICDAENIASWKLMEKLGMRQEARFLSSIYFKEAWRDEVLYALLHYEWRSS